jgi:glycosyltransferase involved in cell wall biosynthesis
MRELGGAPKLRQTLGAGAKALAEQFRWEKIAADTLELYRAIGCLDMDGRLSP